MPRKRQPKVTVWHGQVMLGANKSWRASAWLGLKAGIGWAPTRFFGSIWKPVALLIGGAAALVWTALWAIIGSLGLVACGLCGNLVSTKKPVSEGNSQD